MGSPTPPLPPRAACSTIKPCSFRVPKIDRSSDRRLSRGHVPLPGRPAVLLTLTPTLTLAARARFPLLFSSGHRRASDRFSFARSRRTFPHHSPVPACGAVGSRQAAAVDSNTCPLSKIIGTHTPTRAPTLVNNVNKDATLLYHFHLLDVGR